MADVTDADLAELDRLVDAWWGTPYPRDEFMFQLIGDWLEDHGREDLAVIARRGLVLTAIGMLRRTRELRLG